MKECFIAAAVRTPIGNLNGVLRAVSATELGSCAIGEAVRRTGIEPRHIDEVIVGNVLSAGLGQGPARQAGRGAGLPDSVDATTINKMCGSGLKAVMMAADAIRAGSAEVVVAAGMESMSGAPYLLKKARAGYQMGHGILLDSIVHDGLWDAYGDVHMGSYAELCASKYEFTREAQDDFAARSYTKALKAQEQGWFRDEVVAVDATPQSTAAIVQDERLKRFDETKLRRLAPAFQPTGTITAGNASGINDGAAALVLMSAKEAKKRKLTPLARIASWATVGVDPKVMGSGPIPASRKALEKAGWMAKDLDLIEANEAFAAQALAVNKDVGWDTNKVNVNGGAIAIGHPIGASGARILTTLLHEMQKRDAKKGLATLCIGGGMGIAMCVERD